MNTQIPIEQQGFQRFSFQTQSQFTTSIRRVEPPDEYFAWPPNEQLKQYLGLLN